MVKNRIKHIFSAPLKLLLCLAMIGMSGVLMTTSYYPLAILPSLGIIAAVMLFFHPIYFYYSILFLIPFGQYRFKIDWVITFGLLVVLFLQALSNKKDFFLKRRALFPYIAIFFAQFIISGVFSKYPQVISMNIIKFSFSLLFYFYTIFFVRDKKQFIETIPKIIVLSVSICSLTAILGYFFNIAYFAESVDGGFKRGIGTTRDPNTLALLIIFAIPMIIHMIFNAKTRSNRLVLIILFFINLLAIVTTFSRSGALAVCIILIVVFGKKIKKIEARQLGLIISFLLLSVVILFSLIPPSYWDRQKSLSKSGDKAVGRRLSYVIVGLESVKEHPFFGTGPGTFPEIYAVSGYALKFSKKDQSNKRFAHNSYIEIVVGTGIIGLILFVAILLKTYANYSSSRKKALASGDFELALAIETYRISFIGLIIYVATISNPYHKLLMLSFAISEVAVILTKKNS